jgi:putative spermidine/putrescine transport system permease protein
MLSPMIVPVILVAVGAYFFLAPLSLTSSYTGLILAHTVIAVPFVVVPVLTALEGLDPNLARAAAACGATPATTFCRVTLPASCRRWPRARCSRLRPRSTTSSSRC